MKFKKLIFVIAIVFLCQNIFCGCGSTIKAIELMGAGDRIHDSYTFANVGTKINYEGNNKYTIYGSVEKLVDQNVKKEFKISESIEHIVALKVTAVETDVVKDEVEIFIDGAESYDAEHLNGSTFTYVLLEAKSNSTVNISVKWNKNAEKIDYIIYFAEDIVLK